jgi:hypothetical protein
MTPRATRSTLAAALVVALVLGSGAVAIAAEADATTESERVAKRFLAAYGDYDAKRALQYLAAEGIATGAGHTTQVWGSREGFRREVAMVRAELIDQKLTGCEEQGRSGAGVAVRCPFEFHAFGSDEVGLGPYTENTWDLVVRNGKVTSAVSTWSYLTNGFSSERWEPFQRWVTSTHPEDLPVMYPVGALEISTASIRLWERRLPEFVAAEKAGTV